MLFIQSNLKKVRSNGLLKRIFKSKNLSVCLCGPQEHLSVSNVNKQCMIDTINGGNNKVNSRSRRSVKQENFCIFVKNSLLRIFGGMCVVQPCVSEEILVNIHEFDF